MNFRIPQRRNTSWQYPIWRAWVVVMGTLVAVSVTASFSESFDPAAFVGTKMCGMCHKKAETGDQLGSWKASVHGKAFEHLASPEAKAVGAKMGVDDPQKSGKCLKCHATAYNLTETLQVEKVAVEDGVSCESCHGPGKAYKSKDVMQNHDKAVAAGLVYPATKTCEFCHNNQSPNYNPERYTTKDGKKVAFDVEQAAKATEHPNPAAKK